MDLQGNPLPPGHRSTKVTTDPLSRQQPVEEPSGPVTNDSLAAESIRQGGGFSGNRGAEPMGVSSNQSTVNNTDTSAATKLPPTAAGGLREDRHSQQKYPEDLGGQGNFPGTHLSNSGYSGGSTAAKNEMGMNTGEYSTASGSGRGTQQGDFPADSAKNASFTSDIGSSQDPGREAINQFQHSNAHSAYDSGRPQQKGVGSQTPFEHLESDQRA